MLPTITVHMSAMLAFLSLEAVIIAVLRLVRGPFSDANGAVSPGAARRWVLAAFAIYLVGAVIREAVVMAVGISGWGETAIMVSGVSRVFQLVGAAMFIGGVTHRESGPWIWTTTLASALIFAVLVV